MKKLLLTILVMIALSIPFTSAFGYQRAVLLEEFMSSTCGPCAAAAVWLDPFFMQEGTVKLPVIMYHMNWPSPGNDPWYAANTPELLARRVYYNCSAIPMHMIDGADAGGSLATLQAAYNARLNTPSPVWLSMSTVQASSSDSLIVTLKAVADRPLTNLRLRMALVEIHEHWATAAPNGMTEFEYPFIKFAPDTAGFGFSHSGNTNDTLTYVGRFPPRPDGLEPYTLDNCGIVAFVQNDQSKEVLQSAYCHNIQSPSPQKMAFIGQTNTIRWNSFLADSMAILLNRNYPTGTWDTILNNVPNTGSTNWTANGDPTTLARLRIVSLTRAWNADTSQADFTIGYRSAVSVNPTSLSATMNSNETLTTSLTITNTDTTPFVGSIATRTGAQNYNVLQSTDPGGPTPTWVEPSTGVVGAMGNDVISGPYQLPFSFSFYGQAYNRVWMCSNGWITFDSTTNGSWRRSALPTTEAQSMIAPFWDDLVVAQDSGQARVLIDTINQRAVFSWQNARRWNSTATHIDFQVVLYPNGSFQFNYGTITVLDHRTTVGIQNSSRSSYINLMANNTPVANNSIRFDFVPQWATPSLLALNIAGGASQQIECQWNTTGMAGGMYNGQWSIEGNIVPVVVPVTLIVRATSVAENPANPNQFELMNVYPNPFNPTTEVTFNLQKNGKVEIGLYDITGRLVRQELNQVLPAGNHHHLIQASTLAAGTYFISLKVDHRDAIIRKVVLLK